MNTLRFIDRRVGYFIAAGLILLAAFIPALTSAAQIQQRSIALSSSSVDATEVVYNVEFTAGAAANHIVVDFCSGTDSPIIGQACTTPADFDASDVTASAGFTVDDTSAAADANTVVLDGTVSAAPAVTTVAISGITNPSAAGTIYARILTYTTANAASIESYTSTTPGTYTDEGGIALSITDTIGVSGAVLEALTFCVSGTNITAAACGAGVSSPVLALGETTGSTRALVPGQLSTGNLYGQISTNALGGAAISLKSDATDCGGLMRAGSADCDILPVSTAMTEALIESDASGRFGMLVAAGTDPDSGNNSNGSVAAGTGYDASDFFLAFTGDNSAGVTSTYGSEIANTEGAPANNKNLLFTFGASAQNDTPAGMYAADLSMIATGTF